MSKFFEDVFFAICVLLLLPFFAVITIFSIIYFAGHCATYHLRYAIKRKFQAAKNKGD